MPTITNAATIGGRGTLYNDAELDFSTYKFGTASIKFDGSIKSYVKSSQNFSLGSQDWCLEMWANLAAAQPNASARLAQISTDLPSEFGPGHVSLRAAGGLALVVYDYSPSTPLISTSQNLFGAGWKHVAVSREGSAWRLFVDGALVGSATWAGAITETNPLLLGGNSYSATGMTGWLDDIRLTVGAARYTAAFAVPTQQLPATSVDQPSDQYYSNVSLLLLMNGENNSLTFTDSASSPNSITRFGDAKLSTTQVKFGLTSGFFDGTGDYLTVPSNSGFAFGTGDFTIDAWIYLPSTPTGSYAAIVDLRDNPGGNNSVMFAVDSALALKYYRDSSVLATANNAISINTWTHVAICRNNGTTRLYVNGAALATLNNDTNNITSKTMYIGRVYDAAHSAFSGYIDDLRITKGVARYTDSVFLVPDAQAGATSTIVSPDSLFNNVQVLYTANSYVQYKAYTRSDTITYSQFAPSWPITNKKLDNDPVMLRRVDYGGNGRVYGTVNIKGTPNVPVARRVRLIRDLDGVCVSEVWSDPVTGAYDFRGFDPLQRYTVLAYDYQQNFRAVVADNLTPEAYL